MNSNTPVLLVDDRPENLLSLEQILGDMRLDLRKALSGHEALRLALKEDFALVLLDVQMPDMDGFETAELLRANPRTRHVPIVFVTAGMSDSRSLFKGYESGAVDYLIKPIEPMLLRNKVQVFCDLYRQRMEILDFSKSLERMVEERTAELKKAHDELEWRVHERTEQLLEQSRILESFFQHTLTCLVFLDRKFRFIRVNEAFARACDRPVSDFMGHNYFVDYPSVDLHQKFQSVVDTGEPYVVLERPFEFLDHSEWGATYWDLSVNAVRGSDGEVAFIVFSLQDVTERKIAHQQLHESRRKLLHTLESISDGFFTLDRQWHVTFANREALRRFGKTSEEMAGKSLWEVAPEDRNTVFEEQYSRAMNEPIQVTFEALSPTMGRWIEVRAYPSEEGLSVYFRDLTERRRFQAEAMRAAHLASIGELAAGVAHEINNPINGIINFAQILLDITAPDSQEADAAARIIREGDRIASIVSSLLAFSRQSEPTKAPTALHDIFKDTFNLISALLRKDSVVLKMEIPADLPMVLANGRQIEQVFLNLINNARYALNQKYPGYDGNKILDISAMEADESPGTVRIIFKDHGCGIPTKVIDRVTDAFYSTKPEGVGTGLGLSISLGIVADHGGTFSIESCENEWTRIVIELPRAWENERSFH